MSSPRIEDRFISVWESVQGEALNGSSQTLHRVRRQAIERFAEVGLPASRSEAWKYTNIRKLLESAPQFEGPALPQTISAETIAPLLVDGLDGYVAVLIDGVFSPDLSNLDDLPSGIVVSTLQEAASETPQVFDAYFDRYAGQTADGFVFLNSAFSRDGLFVYVPEGQELDRPVVIYHISTGDQECFLQTRSLLAVAPTAKARVIEVRRSLGSQRVFTNAVTETYTGANAHFDHICLIDEPSSAVIVNTLRSYQAGDSYFATNTITLGGGTVRNQQQYLPDAESCETHLAGLYIGKGSAHIDNHTLVDHAHPNCFSNELFKGILNDQATGVFNGKVLVRQDAQQTNAYQSNKAVLLSEEAQMFAKPELEIYADDVKCSHGATTGELDDEALFYLRSRGLRPAAAKRMLLQAFARDVLERIESPVLREHIDDLVADRLAQ